MNLKPELLKVGSIPALWQDCADLPLYRWRIKRRFRLAPFDVVLIGLLIGLSLILILR